MIAVSVSGRAAGTGVHSTVICQLAGTEGDTPLGVESLTAALLYAYEATCGKFRQPSRVGMKGFKTLLCDDVTNNSGLLWPPGICSPEYSHSSSFAQKAQVRRIVSRCAHAIESHHALLGSTSF